MKLYEDLPYESFAYWYTRPEYLHAVAQLFGHAAPDIKTCRVLEMGCSTGGNLIWMALAYPEAQFVGIDLSDIQVEEARRRAQLVGLENLWFHSLSIEDMPESLGQFDYIICHGVLSWVPPAVQDKIFEHCQRHLHPEGIAFISYNTLPGWNTIRSVREMLRYHTRDIVNSQTKNEEALDFLEFLAETYKDKGDPLSAVFERELRTLKSVFPKYVLFDHMSEQQHPIYLTDFVKKAEKNALKYLYDVDLSFLNISDFTARDMAILNQIDSLVEQEQYKDFIMNRRFRMSLLVHSGVTIDRQFQEQRLERLCYAAERSLKPSHDITGPESFSEELSFLAQQPDEVDTEVGLEISSPDRVASCILYCMSRDHRQRPATVEVISQSVAECLGDVSAEEVRESFLNIAFTFIFMGVWSIHSDPGPPLESLSERPKIHAFNRFACDNGILPANAYHKRVFCNSVKRLFLTWLDGTRTREQLAQCFHDAVKDGTVILDWGESEEQELSVERWFDLVDSLLAEVESDGILIP